MSLTPYSSNLTPQYSFLTPQNLQRGANLLRRAVTSYNRRRPSPYSRDPSLNAMRSKRQLFKKKPRFNTNGRGTSNAVTFQRPSQRRYQKKRGKKSYGSPQLYKSFLFNQKKSHGLKISKFTTTTNPGFSVGVFNSPVAVSALTGFDSAGTVASPNSDLRNLNTLLAGTSTTEAKKFLINNVLLDVTIQLQEGTDLVPLPTSLQLDIYHVKAKVNHRESLSTTYINSMDNNYAQVDVGTVTSSGVSATTDIGSTPFDTSFFGSKWTIINQERVLLSTTSPTYNFTKSLPVNRIFSTDSYGISADTFMPTIGGLTEGYLIVARRLDATIVASDAFIVQSVRRYSVTNILSASDIAQAVVVT